MTNREKEVLKISDDLCKLISYDEWAAKEYGETNIDYYDTAISLYDTGYRKSDDVRKETAKAILDYFDKYANTGKYLIGNMIRNQKEKYGIE